MKDAATNALDRQKSTSLSELFSVELKFTIDTLVKWFGCTFKSKFLELGKIQKQIFTKKNPLIFVKHVVASVNLNFLQVQKKVIKSSKFNNLV